MKSMNLPKISTRKPKYSYTSNPSFGKNILNRNFSVNTLNTVCVSNITYIRLNDCFAYLCILIDLFSHKVISYVVSTKIDSNLVINRLLTREISPRILFFILTTALSILLYLLDGFLTTVMLLNPFQKKSILMIMLLLSLSLNF